MCDDIIHYFLGQVDRNGETVPDKLSGSRRDGRVDADNVSVEVDQCAAPELPGLMAASVWMKSFDWRNRPDRGMTFEASAQGADDAGGDGRPQGQRRANRHDPLTDLDLVGVADRARPGRPSASILMTATSVSESVPTSRASNSSLLLRITVISSARSRLRGGWSEYTRPRSR